MLHVLNFLRRCHGDKVGRNSVVVGEGFEEVGRERWRGKLVGVEGGRDGGCKSFSIRTPEKNANIIRRN